MMTSMLPLLIVLAGTAANMDKIKAFINYAQNVAVQAELNEITKMMVLDKITGDQLPTPDQFPDYLRKNMRVAATKANETGQGRDVTKDQYGTPYRLTYTDTKVRVTSAGLDVTFDTSDDIYSERELQ